MIFLAKLKLSCKNAIIYFQTNKWSGWLNSHYILYQNTNKKKVFYKMIDLKRQGSEFKHNIIQLPRDNILFIYESDYWEAHIFTKK